MPKNTYNCLLEKWKCLFLQDKRKEGGFTLFLYLLYSNILYILEKLFGLHYIVTCPCKKTHKTQATSNVDWRCFGWNLFFPFILLIWLNVAKLISNILVEICCPILGKESEQKSIFIFTNYYSFSCMRLFLWKKGFFPWQIVFTHPLLLKNHWM